jgi:hypothetical protein
VVERPLCTLVLRKALVSITSSSTFFAVFMTLFWGICDGPGVCGGRTGLFSAVGIFLGPFALLGTSFLGCEGIKRDSNVSLRGWEQAGKNVCAWFCAGDNCVYCLLDERGKYSVNADPQ